MKVLEHLATVKERKDVIHRLKEEEIIGYYEEYVQPCF